ncbi:ferredoxin [Patescibacteria group bacterium]|nr:ferredoxin [Patescibacteria group bacterium]
MKTAKVDKDNCIGCSLCVAIAEETFFLDDEGKSTVKENPKDTEEKIQEAIDSCPVQVISWTE